MSDCPDCKAEMVVRPTENCSCHLHAPCSGCVDSPLECKLCGYVEKIEIVNDYRNIVNPDNTYKSWRPRALDSSRVDWHSKSHTNSSMIKEGIYPVGTTKEEVLKLVDGTFGGRFEHFGNGKFKYIAYTD